MRDGLRWVPFSKNNRKKTEAEFLDSYSPFTKTNHLVNNAGQRFMISGIKTRLRSIEDKDLPPLHRWLNDPELMQHWDGRDKPKSMEWIVSHYRPMIDGTDPTECYMIEADGRTIGFIYSRLDPMPDTQHTRAEIDIMIGEADQWDKGYGTDAIRALLGHLFDHKRVHRVYLIPRATNARAIRCYQKCGFVKEGTIRHDDFVEGQWVDGVMMSILEDEYGESHR